MVLTTKQLSKKILAIALSIATMVAFMPMFGSFAYAANETYTLESPTTIPDQAWTGSEPDLMNVDELATITVTGGLILERGTDFTVSTENIAVTDTAKATFTGIGNYEGATIDSSSFSFKIYDPEDTHNYTATVDTSQFTYTGSALTKAAVVNATKVLDNGTKKVPIAADNVTIKNDAVNAGDTTEVIIKVGDVTVYDETVTILKADLANTDVTATIAGGSVYDGTAKEPVVSGVKFGDYVATEADYTVAYSNNINAGDEAVATITATDKCKNYTGSADKKFTIAQFDLSGAHAVFIGKPALTYNGKVQTPESLDVKVYDRNVAGAAEIPASEYQIAYKENAKAVGDYDAYIKPAEGNNNLTGKITGENAWAIVPADMKDVVVSFKEGVSAISAGVDAAANFADYFTVMLGDVELKAGTDFTVAYSKDHRSDVGAESELTLTGDSTNFAGTKKTTTYKADSIALAEVYTSTYSPVYSGAEFRPAASTLGTLTVKGGTATLTSGNYVVTDWANNVNAGTATASIEGKNRYEGKKSTVEFTIETKSITGLETATVAGIAEGNYYLNQVVEGATVTGKIDGETVTLGADDCDVAIAKIEDGYVTEVTVTGKGNYAGSADVPVNVKCNVASLDNAVVSTEIPAGLSGYGASMIKKYTTVTIDGEVVNPDAYYLKAANITKPDPVEVGSEITVKFTAKDVAGSKEATLKVVARDLSELEEPVAFTSDETYTYDGTAKEPGVTVTAPDAANTPLTAGTDYTVAYTDNTNAGTATVTVTGKGNYTGSVSKTFTIGKAHVNAVMYNLVYADSIDKQFAVGAPADQSAAITLQGTGNYVFDASDYTVTLAKKPVQVGTSAPKAEVEATDTAAATSILYNVAINESSKNYVADDALTVASYTLVPKTVKNAEITLNADGKVAYAGAISKDDMITKLAPVVKVDGATLTVGTDYTVDVEPASTFYELTADNNPTKVVVTFTGNYIGTAKQDYTVEAAGNEDLSNLKLIKPTAAQSVYSGSAITPDVSYIGDKPTNPFVAGTDYVLTYTDANGEQVEASAVKNVGTYTCTMTAAEKWGGAVIDAVTYEISAKKLTQSEFNTKANGITLADTTYAGASTEAPALRGTDSDQFEVTEFTTDWDGTSQGEAKIALKADANYAYDGTVDKKFTFVKGDPAKSLNVADFYAFDDQTYTGMELEPALKATGALPIEYAEVKYYENNKDANVNKTAKAEVTVTIPSGNALYKAGTVTGFVTFKINPAPIADQTITVAKATYAGKAVTPKVTIKDADGALLTLDKDYKVAYKNNTKAGKGTVTVTGIKNYTGETDVQFTINKGVQKITKVTPASKSYKANKKTKKLAKTYKFTLKATATPAKGGGKVTFKKANKIGGAKVVVAKTGKVTVKKGLKKGTYKVKVKATKAANANYKVATKTVTVKIIVK